MSTTVNVGKSINVEIDWAKLIPNSDKTAGWTDVSFGETLDHLIEQSPALAHVLYIGARNILMDSHASITADEYPDVDKRQEAASAMVQKKLDALMNGEVRVQSTREGDPVRAEAIRMATDIVKAKIKKSGKKVADYEAKAVREAALKLVTPELLAQAKARVDETRAATPDTATLADLGL